MSKIKAKGKRGQLIDENCKLKKQAKEIEEKMAANKELLKSKHSIGDKEATYITEKGNILEVKTRNNFHDISPSELMKTLKAKRKGSKFSECVKVVVDKAKKFLDADELKKLRKQGADTFTWSFK